MIIFILTSKFDKETAQEWEKYKPQDIYPSLENMKQFLKSRADVLETIENNVDSKFVKRVKSASFLTTKTFKCNFCKDDHLIYGCKTFLNLPVRDRSEHVTKLKLCRNCLCSGHDVEKCRSSGCKKCKSKHNTLLHLEKDDDTAESSANVNAQVSLSSQLSNTDVLLSTVVLYAVDNVGNTHELRALLDSGSQSNFITEAACKKLQLSKLKTNLNVVGLNKMTSKLNDKCSFTIQSRYNKFSTKIECFVLEKITANYPHKQLKLLL